MKNERVIVIIKKSRVNKEIHRILVNKKKNVEKKRIIIIKKKRANAKFLKCVFFFN